MNSGVQGKAQTTWQNSVSDNRLTKQPKVYFYVPSQRFPENWSQLNSGSRGVWVCSINSQGRRLKNLMTAPCLRAAQTKKLAASEHEEAGDAAPGPGQWSESTKEAAATAAHSKAKEPESGTFRGSCRKMPGSIRGSECLLPPFCHSIWAPAFWKSPLAESGSLLLNTDPQASLVQKPSQMPRCVLPML